MNIVAEYIKYKLKAKKRHGVHSPFLYEFGDKCLKINLDQKHQMKIDLLTNELIIDNRQIEVTDLGAGSKKMNDQRKIKKIFKNSSSKGKYGRLLYQISQHYKIQNALELGTSLGIGSSYISFGNNPKLTTIEGCPNTFELAKENFKKLGIAPNIINAEFDSYLSTLNDEKFDLIFIDGNHNGEATIKYVNQLKQHSHSNTFFILDDIRWSDDMYLAWNQLVSDNYFHVSMDLFRIGILLPRTEQEKEHFTVNL